MANDKPDTRQTAMNAILEEIIAIRTEIRGKEQTIDGLRTAYTALENRSEGFAPPEGADECGIDQQVADRLFEILSGDPDDPTRPVMQTTELCKAIGLSTLAALMVDEILENDPRFMATPERKKYGGRSWYVIDYKAIQEDMDSAYDYRYADKLHDFLRANGGGPMTRWQIEEGLRDTGFPWDRWDYITRDPRFIVNTGGADGKSYTTYQTYESTINQEEAKANLAQKANENPELLRKGRR